MNEEEKKAIETMQHWIEYEKENKDKINKADELIEIQETVLNLLEKKDKESHFIQSELDIANAKIIELNKIIDEMANKIFEEGVIWESKEEVKKYYERKVENGN